MIELEHVGVIGDPHGEIARMKSALAHFDALGMKHVLCVGDIADGPAGPAGLDACCALLEARKVFTVGGNHDRWLQDNEMRDMKGALDRDEVKPETLAYLAALPLTLTFASPAGQVMLCHGLGDNDLGTVQPFDHGYALDSNEALQTLLREASCRYVINGHTHRPMVRTISGITIINAGTLHREYEACCVTLDFRAKRASFWPLLPDGTVSPAAQLHEL